MHVMAKGCIPGRMVIAIKGSSMKTNVKARASFTLPMATNIPATLWMVSLKDLANIALTVVNTMVVGLVDGIMVTGRLFFTMERHTKENLRMEVSPIAFCIPLASLHYLELGWFGKGLTFMSLSSFSTFPCHQSQTARGKRPQLMETFVVAFGSAVGPPSSNLPNPHDFAASSSFL
jgi:hypothetical protein